MQNSFGRVGEAVDDGQRAHGQMRRVTLIANSQASNWQPEHKSDQGKQGALKNNLFWMNLFDYKYDTRQVSLMIHSARPIVTPVANIVFCCFVFLDLKSEDERTDNMCEDNDLYRPSGSIVSCTLW